MLTIREEQLRRLEAVKRQKFVQEVCDFLRDTFDGVPPPGELTPAVEEQVERARAYGLATERQILVYVVTAWLLGTRFDEKLPAARLVLTDESYSPEDKREWLADWTVELLGRLSPDTVVPSLLLNR